MLQLILNSFIYGPYIKLYPWFASESFPTPSENVDKAGIFVGRSLFFERGRVLLVRDHGCSEWRFYPSFHFTLGVIYLIGCER